MYGYESCGYFFFDEMVDEYGCFYYNGKDLTGEDIHSYCYPLYEVCSRKTIEDEDTTSER